MDLLDQLEIGPVLCDGAMGSLLLAGGAVVGSCLEEMCISQPEQVAAIHRGYLKAGSRIIRTNSFGGNAVRLARLGMERRVNELNWAASQIARECAKGSEALVAGSVGPLGISLEELEAKGLSPERLFFEQIGALLDGGAQIIFLETFTCLREMEIALYVKQSLHHCPVICSFASGIGRGVGTVPLDEAFRRVTDLGADLTGLNCVDADFALQVAKGSDRHLAFSAFPSAGLPVSTGNDTVYPVGPLKFATVMLDIALAGTKLLGGCCGTTPAYIEAVAEALAPSVDAAPPNS